MQTVKIGSHFVTKYIACVMYIYLCMKSLLVRSFTDVIVLVYDVDANCMYQTGEEDTQLLHIAVHTDEFMTVRQLLNDVCVI